MDRLFSFLGDTFVRLIGNAWLLAAILIGTGAVVAVATVVARRSSRKRSQSAAAKSFQMTAEDRLPPHVESRASRKRIEASMAAIGDDGGINPESITPVPQCGTSASAGASKSTQSRMPLFALSSGDYAAAAAASAAAIFKSPAERALAIQRGKMVEKIPRQMQVGVREPVEIRLGTPEAQNLMLGLMGSGAVAELEVDIVETMSVELFSPDGAFGIDVASPTTQLVRRDVLKGTPFATFAADFGQWIWYVTPQERGKHPLSIRVSASVLDSKGAQANAALPDRMIVIEVSVSLARASSSISKKIALLAASGSVTGIAGAIVGALTKDYWWPMVAPFFK